jgi:hypothetical protein
MKMFTNETELMAERAAAAVAEKAEQERLRKIESREAAAKWQETQRAAQAIELQNELKHLRAIAAQIVGMKVTLNEERGYLFVDDIRASIYFDSYSRSRTMRVDAGGFKNEVRLPMKKDGTYSYKKAADAVRSYVMREIAHTAASRNVEQNKELTAKVKAQLKLATYCSVIEPSTMLENPIRVHIDLKTATTAEKAVQLVEAIRALGFTVGY